MNDKSYYGQFFTRTNPFYQPIVYDWFDLIPEEEKQVIVEPFAGRNNIVNLINDLYGNRTFTWKCYDIDESLLDKSTAEGVQIEVRDCLKNYPVGVGSLAITNPPYLSKVSASRQKTDSERLNGFSDLYQACLDVMLENERWVAAIVPETFIPSALFTNRLYAAVSLTCKMFDDTDCPVCLALFVPEETKLEMAENGELSNEDDFFLYKNNRPDGSNPYIGRMSDILKSREDYPEIIKWKFNDKAGSVGLHGIDGNKGESIEFIPGENVDPDKIKVSSRAITRISGLPEDADLEKFLSVCNECLAQYRKASSDVLMASFKGLRDDGYYRRRIDFKTVRMLMNKAYWLMTHEGEQAA